MPVPYKSIGLCGAKTIHRNGVTFYECRRRKDHIEKPGKYSRQHMDSKPSPPYYWEPTAEEIDNYYADKAEANAT